MKGKLTNKQQELFNKFKEAYRECVSANIAFVFDSHGCDILAYNGKDVGSEYYFEDSMGDDVENYAVNIDDLHGEWYALDGTMVYDSSYDKLYVEKKEDIDKVLE